MSLAQSGDVECNDTWNQGETVARERTRTCRHLHSQSHLGQPHRTEACFTRSVRLLPQPQPFLWRPHRLLHPAKLPYHVSRTDVSASRRRCIATSRRRSPFPYHSSVNKRRTFDPRSLALALALGCRRAFHDIRDLATTSPVLTLHPTGFAQTQFLVAGPIAAPRQPSRADVYRLCDELAAEVARRRERVPDKVR
jgi:hypothetical protein